MSDLTPYLCVPDARAAMEWYVDVLGASRRFDPIVMQSGQVGHVELMIGGGRVMMSDPFDSAGVAPPDTERGNAISLHLTVADVDAVTDRAVSAGAIVDRGPEDTDHGRVAVLHDPFGHRWMLNSDA